MRGKLNIFQKTMLMWAGMHPYNAVHAVIINSPPDRERLLRSIRGFIEMNGPGMLSILEDGKTVEFKRGGVAPDVEFIDGAGNSEQKVAQEMQRQINLPFEGRTFMPLRFFVVEGRGFFYLGVTYFHAVSDAVSIIGFIRAIADSYKKGEVLGWEVKPYTRGLTIRETVKVRYLFNWLYDLPAHIRQLRRLFRPEYEDDKDMENGFVLFRIGCSDFKKLRDTARVWKVTVNDLFIAILMKAVAPLAGRRWDQVRRREIAVKSIVDIRRDLDIADAGTMGLFLGAFSVSHDSPESTDLKRLVLEIHLQTEIIKERKLYLGTIPELALSFFLLKRFFAERKEKFYSKYYPHWGGITNINMDRLWGNDAGEGSPVDYIRAVSTGPVVPVVFSITTVRDQVSVGVSYRKAAFSEDAVGGIISRFSGEISGL